MSQNPEYVEAVGGWACNWCASVVVNKTAHTDYHRAILGAFDQRDKAIVGAFKNRDEGMATVVNLLIDSKVLVGPKIEIYDGHYGYLTEDE